MIIENEWKFLVSEEQFLSIMSFFEKNFDVRKEIFDQINYYYDTDNLALSKEGITARIRDKNNELNGTFKKHFENGISQENDFEVDSVPQSIMYGKTKLKKLGFLLTKRFVFYIEKMCEICFDENYYLGEKDFEIEIEFIGDYSGLIYLPNRSNTPSKYSRFLSKYEKTRTKKAPD